MRIQPEYVSSDILDSDFLSPFTLHFYTQTILLCNRVVAKDRFATGPSTLDKVLTVLACFAVALTYYLARNTYFELYGQFDDIFLLCSVGTAAKYICCMTHILKVRLFDGDAAVEMLVKLQEIDRVMGIHNTKRLRQITKNAAITGLAILFFIDLLYLTASFLKPIPNLTLVMLCTMWTLSTFWLEVSLCSIISYSFLSKTKYLNALLRTQLKPGVNCTKPLRRWQWLKSKFTPLSDRAMDSLVAQNGHNFESSNADTQLRELFKGFELYRKAYQFQILLQVAVGVVWMVVTFEVVILGVQRDAVNDSTIAYFTEFLVDVCRITTVIGQVESVFRDLRRTKGLVLAILSQHCEGPVWKKAKRMLKCFEDIPPVFSVYDMFEINAHFMFTLFNLATNYLVTLLQLAYI